MNFLDGYSISELIYKSDNSTIYRGFRERDRTPVILKLPSETSPTPETIARYKKEYEIARALKSRGIVTALDCQESFHSVVLVFEDIGAVPLKQRVSAGLGLAEFLDIAIQLSEIVAQIHEGGAIHKDINPNNILFDPKTQNIKLIDFGISTTFTHENFSPQSVNVLEGTLAYLSPEQSGRMNRHLDYRTDFYSLGITFYELLLGQIPFTTQDPLELVHCHIAKQPTPPHHLNEKVPEIISKIVLKLIAKTAEERYQSAWGLKCDLEYCLEQLQMTGVIVPFQLGMKDIPSRFQVSQKLYGREAEIEKLLKAFERVAMGETSGAYTILVSGYSGIGKSTLVRELYKELPRTHGYFISGKFEQFQRDIPYYALISAFSNLVEQLLTETTENLQKWRDKILASLGENSQIIIDLIPKVELIIGSQPAVPEMRGIEAQNRFTLVFQNFIRVFCDREHPLILFLDDLQWADLATLKLLELLTSDRNTQYLLLISSYRDNEVDAIHPLRQTLEIIASHHQEAIAEIRLVPLELEQIEMLIADTLHHSSESVRPLAQLVLNKTGGNPFFINEFLKVLYREGLLYLNFSRLTDNTNRDLIWEWDLAAIEQLKATDNIVDLIAGRLRNLPDFVRDVLQCAACLGIQFDRNLLSQICNASEEEVLNALEEAVRAELLLTLFSYSKTHILTQYKFAHDRIQQAAYNSLNPSDRIALQLNIARLLLQHTPSEHLSDRIFEIIDRFNLAISLVTDATERQEVARLNLLAGRKAKAAAAYSAAVKYLEKSLSLCPQNSWESYYDFTLTVCEEAIEAHYLNTNFERAESLADIVLKNAKQNLDRIKTQELIIQSYTAQNKPSQALELGISTLEIIGLPLETDLEWELSLPALESLERVAQMSNPLDLSAMRVLMVICPSAYFIDPQKLLAIVLTMVNLTLRKGHSALSAYAYVWYAALSSALGKFELGYQAGQLALNLVDRYNAKDLKAKVYNLFCALVRHWKEPARNSIPMLQEGIRFGFETGDREYACYCIKDYCVHLFMSGEPLQWVVTRMQENEPKLLESKQYYSIYQTQIWQQVCCNLLNPKSYSPSLQGDTFDEVEILSILQESNNRTLLCVFYLAKLNLAYLFKDYSAALYHARAVDEYLDAVMGFLYVAIHNFYDSLALLALASENPSVDLERVESNQKQLKEWANLAPANFKHKYELVEAERARVAGNYWQAAELYNCAVRGANENCYLQEEALACELAAEFYWERNLNPLAQTYFQSAIESYRNWQAFAKVKQLEKRYISIFGELIHTTHNTQKTNEISLKTIKTTSDSQHLLDLASIIKASQTIGGEIILADLLKKLLKILIENAGAQTGYLLLAQNGNFFIEAAGSIDSENVSVLQSLPLENRLPLSVINYVARLHESVALDNATLEGNFTNDRYIQQNQAKSILCVPAIEQGQLTSIVYLENSLTPGAFSRDRVEVIKILATQAAISIENACLYQTLEDKVAKRTAELAEANAEITLLNERLKQENVRLSAEVEVVKRLQAMVLPKTAELQAIESLDIAVYMEPADEVGGDYYDVWKYDGGVKIAIGDVTGHGLESGVLTIMAQTAARSIHNEGQTNPCQFLNSLNRTLYDNIQRMNSDKSMSFILLDYRDGTLEFSGQHEEIIVVRAEGKIERIDTIDLGFPLALEPDIINFVAQRQITLESGDVVFLYTDGITEAFNLKRKEYGIDRLCEVLLAHYRENVEKICQAVVEDVQRYIGDQKVFDDLAIVVVKQK
ncbi:AAA family ATPase [Oscillatoria sp. FACHB-1406]|nr:AAA family ATPase [Oscillatoria sp. FACHB-1406]MBD2576412.1 AAA family ATPase [Oscillatoria sp. FACHB-1406]